MPLSRTEFQVESNKISWSLDGKKLAAGNIEGMINIYDVKEVKIKFILAWNTP